MIFVVFGGLGLFLLGLKTMSDGLKNLAGNRMRSIIGKATANRFLGLLFGMLVTAATQSSTATSVMSIGFVNAGLMKLKQFAPIIIGAGIGTTFTAFMFSFRIDHIAPILIFLGISMYLFIKKKKISNIGFVTLGIGLLFFGLSTMGEPLQGFSQMDGFQRALIAFENPLLALLTGLLLTAIIQSSTATIGIVITMYLSGVDLSFTTAVFIVLGANIGTCSTALLSSLAGSLESKRAAMIHATYKLISAGSFALLILIFPSILVWFQTTWQEESVQVAMFNTLYNLGAAGVMIFFRDQLVALVYLIIPKKTEEDSAKQLLHLGQNNERTPEVIFEQSHREICRMGLIVFDNLQLALEAFFESNHEKAFNVIDQEETVDYLRNEIDAHLMRIQSTQLTTDDIEKLGLMLGTVSDLERLGDHAENIAEYVVSEESQRTYISPDAIEELNTLSKAMMSTLTLALKVLETNDNSHMAQIADLEQLVDDLCQQYLRKHIVSLKEKKRDPRSSVVFTNLVTDLERCSDHAVNIAEKFA